MPDPTPITCEQILAFFQSHDAFAAVELIQCDGNPFAIVQRYTSLIPDLYWKYKHLASVTMLSQAGIVYALGQAARTADAEQQNVLASAAKGLAYNLGSFTWPGWDEAGITITPADLALGLAAARLNLRLAIALQKPPAKVRNAHWLLGAQLLAAFSHQAALEEFRLSLPSPTEKPEPLFEGYVELTRIIMKESDAAAAFDAILAPLTGQTDKDSRFIHEQLTTARRVFAPA